MTACALLFTLVGSAAAAGTPSQSAYGCTSGTTNCEQLIPNNGGQLPFTGINVGLVAILGAGVAGGGIAIRRALAPRRN